MCLPASPDKSKSSLLLSTTASFPSSAFPISFTPFAVYIIIDSFRVEVSIRGGKVICGHKMIAIQYVPDRMSFRHWVLYHKMRAFSILRIIIVRLVLYLCPNANTNVRDHGCFYANEDSSCFNYQDDYCTSDAVALSSNLYKWITNKARN